MQMNWFQKHKYWLIVSILIFGIGITIGELFDWGYFELSKEISVVEALNVFVTVGLTIYIAGVLEKQQRFEQFKTDLYISKIIEIENHLQKIEVILQETQSQYQPINTIIHIIGLAKNDLMKSIQKDDAIDENGIRSIEERLKEKHKELKYLLTNRPIAKNDKSVVVAKNIVQYSLDRKIEITNIINSIKSEYFNLKILLKS